MRGEYVTHAPLPPTIKELPPRARRIQGFLFTIDVVAGTTSACAENTEYLPNCEPFAWNYLRVRGEYRRARSLTVCSVELPPRARRILHQINPYTGETGTTSACAENTGFDKIILTELRNYLRVRGEYCTRPC